ncbi:DUF4132 domain-containing protein [Catenuloplanes sp. NPDC051500]|uniref:DUF4132 domain-containing protein n=1 Tax=Catenuloplanes sp. NPDC051500 TaxID=3363959 RepID=UPI0037A39448
MRVDGDENELVRWDDWAPPLPWRGEAGPVALDPDAAATVAAVLAPRAGKVARVLRRDDVAPEIVSAPADSPLGAAVRAYLTFWTSEWDDQHDIGRMNAGLADAWITTHGLDFAVRAAAELARLDHSGRDYDDDARPPAHVARADRLAYFSRMSGTLERLRDVLAGAPEEEYRRAVGALGEVRAATPWPARAVTSFLAPDQVAWAAEDAERDLDADAATLLAASLRGDPATLRRVGTASSVSWGLPRFASTFALAGGEAAVPAFARTETDHAHRHLAGLPYEGALAVLRDRIADRATRQWLAVAVERYPARAVRVLAGGGDHRFVGELLRQHVLAHPDIARCTLPDHPLVAAVLAELDAVPGGDPPPLLAEPPWAVRRKTVKPVVVPGLVCDDPPTIDWRPGERVLPDGRGQQRDWQADADGWAGQGNWLKVRMFLYGPEELARPLLAGFRFHSGSEAEHSLPGLVARFGVDAFPAAIEVVRGEPGPHAATMLPYAAPELAVLVAEWLAHRKSLRGTARAWLLRHPARAARALIPPALGPAGRPRREAEAALRALAAAGHARTVHDAAADYGDDAAAGIGALLGTDPLTILPARVPAVPRELTDAVLPPLLRGGDRRLPGAATPALATVFAMSTLEQPYAGVAVLKDALDPADLSRWAWDLFRRWYLTGTDPKHGWIMAAIGLAGDDAITVPFTRFILAWPGEGGHARAVEGLSALAAIGTEAALQQLHRVAQRSTFKGLKSAARQKIDEVAAGLGLTGEQLADRLVPDLGLAPDGSLTIDYGPRRFTARFDEQLRPYVTDEAGRTLKALPKPGAKDDPELAPAGAKRFAAVKKEVRPIARDVIDRLERAMADGREWTTEEFHTYLAGHPLVGRVARRLLWSADGVTFRIAEDGTFADAADARVKPPAGAVTVPHPLRLAHGELSAWAELFADYELLQPFPQLGRDTFTRTAEEEGATRLTRLEGAGVHIPRLLALEKHGRWRRGPAQDAGIVGEFNGTLPGGVEVSIDLNPGFSITEVDDYSSLDRISLSWGHTLGDLDPVVFSELVRDLTEAVDAS